MKSPLDSVAHRHLPPTWPGLKSNYRLSTTRERRSEMSEEIAGSF